MYLCPVREPAPEVVVAVDAESGVVVAVEEVGGSVTVLLLAPPGAVEVPAGFHGWVVDSFYNLVSHRGAILYQILKAK